MIHWKDDEAARLGLEHCAGGEVLGSIPLAPLGDPDSLGLRARDDEGAHHEPARHERGPTRLEYHRVSLPALEGIGIALERSRDDGWSRWATVDGEGIDCVPADLAGDAVRRPRDPSVVELDLSLALPIALRRPDGSGVALVRRDECAALVAIRPGHSHAHARSANALKEHLATIGRMKAAQAHTDAALHLELTLDERVLATIRHAQAWIDVTPHHRAWHDDAPAIWSRALAHLRQGTP